MGLASHVGKYEPACCIVCPFIPPILCFVLFDCLFGRGNGSGVILLYTYTLHFFSKGISSFVSLYVCMPWDPLKGDVDAMSSDNFSSSFRMVLSFESSFSKASRTDLASEKMMLLCFSVYVKLSERW